MFLSHKKTPLTLNLYSWHQASSPNQRKIPHDDTSLSEIETNTSKVCGHEKEPTFGY